MRILVVEDELLLRQQLVEFLQSKGFVVDATDSGKEALFLGQEYPIDIAVVDLGLPDLSGMAVIQTLRKQGQTFPVLILTARTRWQEKVEGLEAGADDYLEKPFHYEELWARLNALLRRSGGQAHPLIKIGGIEVDMTSQTVAVEGNEVELTAFEYKVLEYLLHHRGEVVTKATLTEHIYEQDFDRDSNVIEVFVGRLRKKLDPDGQLKIIETLRGRGYRISL